MKVSLCGRLYCYKIPWRLSLSSCWNRCSRNFRFALYIMDGYAKCGGHSHMC
ncbi:hypothetical protein Hanom_Chr14g01252121 [Helianthus anomalus]